MRSVKNCSFALGYCYLQPMPLVDPVTIVTLPSNMGILFDVLRDEICAGSR